MSRLGPWSSRWGAGVLMCSRTAEIADVAGRLLMLSAVSGRPSTALVRSVPAMAKLSGRLAEREPVIDRTCSTDSARVAPWAISMIALVAWAGPEPS